MKKLGPMEAVMSFIFVGLIVWICWSGFPFGDKEGEYRLTYNSITKEYAIEEHINQWYNFLEHQWERGHYRYTDKVEALRVLEILEKDRREEDQRSARIDLERKELKEAWEVVK